MVPENCYVNQRELEPFPFGIRIDYVLYKVSVPPQCVFTHCVCFSPACADLRSLMAGQWEEALKDVSFWP